MTTATYSYSYKDFGPTKSGPQFALLDERLTVWGQPSNSLLDTPKNRIYRWQEAIGNTPDGILGPKQWALLQTDPPNPTPVPKISDLKFFKSQDPDGDHFDLDTYASEYFMRRPDGSILFRVAAADSAVTPNSSYPRSELRELNEAGDSAKWNPMRGDHLMTVHGQIVEVPGKKPEIVVGQIHDAKDDIVMVRYEDGHLFVEASGKNVGDLDLDLPLNEPFYFSISVHAGVVTVNYNGVKTVTYKPTRLKADWYFKTGAYCQANASNGTGHASFLMTGLELSHV